MQCEGLCIAPGTSIMQGHYGTRSKELNIRGGKRRIVHHIQVQARQDQWVPELFNKQFICGWTDDRIERILKWHKFWMYLMSKEKNIPDRGFCLLQEEKMFGNFSSITKNSRRTPPDCCKIYTNA